MLKKLNELFEKMEGKINPDSYYQNYDFRIDKKTLTDAYRNIDNNEKTYTWVVRGSGTQLINNGNVTDFDKCWIEELSRRNDFQKFLIIINKEDAYIL